MVDVGGYLVVYNLIIGVLVMLSSEKIGSYAGALNKVHKANLIRVTRISMFTFGACVAVLSGSIYIFIFILKFGG